MKRLPKKIAVGTMLLAGMSSGLPAQAGNETMLKLLEVLRDNGTINAEAYEMLRDAALEEDAQEPAGSEASEQPATAPDEATTTVELKDSGLDVRSKARGARLRLGGRLHLDSARYNESEIPFGDGSKVRRIRLEARANVAENWRAVGNVEFSDNEVDLKSTYLEYQGFENSGLKIGNFKEPFSLEELSSSNDSVFMERAMMTEFAPGRHFGVGINRWGEHASFAAGIFGEGISDETEDDAGWGSSARLTWFPILDEGKVVHFGGALSYREPGDDDSFRLRTRPESGVADVRLVDTGLIPGVEDVTRTGLEAAGVLGPVSLQGEYVTASVSRSGGLTDLEFSGWYALAAWTLTGESRQYRANRGRMGSVVPDHNFGAGGIGAWEIAARFSSVDLTDDEIVGGLQDNLTLGLNWYASPNIRFMFNYVDVLDVDRPGTPEDGEDPDIFQVRAQFNY